MNEEYKKILKRSARFSILWLILILLAGTASTYAWFTFTASTNVTPMNGRITKGDVELLIATEADGEYSTSVVLNPTLPGNSYSYTDPETGDTLYATGELIPVSTVDLQTFFIDTRQDEKQLIVRFEEAENPQNYLVHGILYLKAVMNPCNLYFSDELSFIADAQNLAALRLGLKISDGTNEKTAIFKLDSMISDAELSNVVSTSTVTEENVVVYHVNADGSASFVQDPAVAIASCIKDNEGATPIFEMQADTVTEVEFWIYLEGCDVNCLKQVAGDDLTYLLGFEGEKLDEEE